MKETFDDKVAFFAHMLWQDVGKGKDNALRFVVNEVPDESAELAMLYHQAAIGATAEAVGHAVIAMLRHRIDVNAQRLAWDEK